MKCASSRSGRLLRACAALAAALFAASLAVADRVVVKFAPSSNLPKFSAASAFDPVSVALRAHGAQVLFSSAQRAAKADLARRFGLDRTWVLEVRDGPALCRKLASLPNVEHAQPVVKARPALVPNDTYFPQQWALQNTGQSGGTPGADIKAPAAWDITTGGDVIVAVIDTGVDPSHPEFTGRLVPGQDFTVNPSNGNTADVCGHGTNCAGIVGAAGNNNQGVAGISWGARIMPLRVFVYDGGCWGEDVWVGDAIGWAADHGAKVASMSLVLDAYSQYVADKAAYALANGVTLCSAMGNDYNPTVRYPAALPGVIAVGATTNTDARASFSNWGNHIAVTAPGSSVYTTSNGGGYYCCFGGTSAATPHVAGLCSLILSLNPLLTPAEVRKIVMDTADDLGAPGWDQYFGAGRINAWRAVFRTAYPTIGKIKTLPDAASVFTRDKIVTAVFENCFYIQDPDRSSGIKVMSTATVAEGNTVAVNGSLNTVAGERAIQATSVLATP